MSQKDALPTGKFMRSAITGLTTARIGVKYLAHTSKKPFRKPSQQSQAQYSKEVGEILINTFMQLRGTALKIAQMLSMELEFLPEPMRQQLQKACSHVTPLNRAHVYKVFMSEFGQRPEAMFMEFEHEAFAAASLGQVHRARLFTGEKVAVKIQYPGIAACIRSDMELVRGLLRPLSKRSDYLPDWPVIEGVLSGIAAQLEQEVDYWQEARNTRWFAERMPIHGPIVPHVHESVSSGRILVTEYIEGAHLDEWLNANPTQSLRNQLGQQLFDQFCYQIHVLGCLHADPHPGNFLINNADKLVLIDFGCIQRLSPDFPSVLADLCSTDTNRIYRAYKNRNIILDNVSQQQFEEEFLPVAQESQEWLSGPFQQESYDFSTMPAAPKTRHKQHKTAVRQLGAIEQDQIYFDRSFIGLLSLLRKLGAVINTRGLFSSPARSGV